MTDSRYRIYGVFHWWKHIGDWRFDVCDTVEEAIALAERIAIGEGIRKYNRRHVSCTTPEGIELVQYIVPHVEPDEASDGDAY